MSFWGVDSSILADLDNATFFPSLCTIQVNTTGTQDDSGCEQPVLTDLTDHVDIPCRVGPLVIDRPSAEVARGAAVEIRYKDLHLLLKGYYPGVDMTMYALVDGYVYQIDNVQHDGNHITTRFRIFDAKSV